MSKINIPIPSSSFELIRDRIATILKDELSNQYMISNYDDSIDAEVLIEAINPEDKEELPVVNVSLAADKFSLKDYAGEVKGSIVYNIDVYTNAKTDENAYGDYKSARALQRMLAFCRYILENPVYKTLGYTPPFIQRVYISDMNIANKGRNDALNSMMGRLTFNVEVNENVTLLNAQLIDGFDTTVKLANSSKGYFWDNDYGY